MATELGTYRIAAHERGRDLEVVVSDPAGVPVEEAWVRISRAHRPWLVDPGECDTTDEARCRHPAGRYRARGDGEGPVTVEVDGSAGFDRAVLDPGRN